MSSLSFKIEKPKHNQKKEYDEFQSSESDEEFISNKKNKKQKLELINEFDSTNQKEENKKSEFMIPSLPNRDFRSIYLTKKSTKTLYKPDKLNSFGEKSTNQKEIKTYENVNQMNSSNVSGGLKLNEIKAIRNEEENGLEKEEKEEDLVEKEIEKKVLKSVLTLEEKAIQELIEESGGNLNSEKKELEPILMIPENSPSPSTSSSNSYEDETIAFRKDVSKRPNPSSLEDYERVPVGSFGLALLKGMGWKEGTSASKNGRVGLLEAVVPKARPSLLGIGAKPLVIDEGNKSTGIVKKGKGKDDRKYVPLIRKVIDPETRGTDSNSSKPSSSKSYSRPRSRSRSPSTSRSTTYRDKSPSRSDKHQSKSRYLEDEERNLKDLRIEDRGDRSRRDDRDRDRDHARKDRTERNDKGSRYREERGERSRRDDREDRSRRDDREDRSRRDDRESSKYRDDRDDRSRRDDRESNKYRNDRDDKSRRDDRDSNRYKEEREGKSQRDYRDDDHGTYRKNGKDEDRYRKSYK